MFNESGKPGVLDESAQALATRLRREIAERDDLLALTAHELRNPLHALSMQLALARSTAQAHAQADTVARIAKAQTTLARYIDRVTVLLQLACLNADDYPLCSKPVDLSAIVKEMAESLGAEAQVRGVGLVVDVPASLPALCDALVVEQIIENLLLNAFKHAACTSVQLSLRSRDDGQAEIVVADDGRGISSADQERIFDKFGVADNGRRDSGTGLGLWIVRKLLAVMGGRISLSSQPGAGSVFAVSFPLSDRPEPVT